MFEGRRVPLVHLAGDGRTHLDHLQRRKAFAFTGWKIGWARRTGPAGGGGAHRQTVPHLRQRGTFPAGRGRRPGVCPTTTSRARPRPSRPGGTGCCTGLDQAGFEVCETHATYFVITGVAGFGVSDGVEFCRTLAERCGVVAVPAAAFYDDPRRLRPLVRFAFCKQPDVLDEAVARLGQLRPAGRST